MIFTNAQIIFPDRIQPQSQVRVANGKIVDISTQPLVSSKDDEVTDVSGQYLAPGFIDLHVHGALNRDTMEADAGAFRVICGHHTAGGTTSLALTTLAAPAERILRVLQAVQAFQNTPDGAQVLGVHLEGPYFSKEKPGAHRLDWIHNPVPTEYARLLEHSKTITQMTLAPELPGSLELIDALRAHGIRASGGHSNAWDEEALSAFDHGMRQVTHTFNCMSSARRHGAYRVAGLLEFAISKAEILCELIADDRHVSATLMQMLYRAKGPDGICLVTDATAGAGLPAGTAFKLGEIECVVHDGVAFTADGKALAGSTAGMIQCVRNMVKRVGVPLVEAVGMATRNPARALGIENQKGRLAAGMDADLVIISENLEVLKTYKKGRLIFDAAENSPHPQFRSNMAATAD